MTAIEWLENEVYKAIENTSENSINYVLEKLFEQAKEMEKQQMKMAQMHYSSDVVGFKTLLENQFEDYYNETFKSE